MAKKPKAWDEAFERETYTPEEIEASDKRVAQIQHSINATQVINGLKHELRNRGKCGHYCREGIETISCKYDQDGLCIQHWGNDALALLNALEPRVMTLEEALHAPFAWTETRDGYMSIRRIRGIRNEPTNMTVEGFSITMAIVPKAKYGRFVRCWTSRPTDTKREVTPWP